MFQKEGEKVQSGEDPSGKAPRRGSTGEKMSSEQKGMEVQKRKGGNAGKSSKRDHSRKGGLFSKERRKWNFEKKGGQSLTGALHSPQVVGFLFFFLVPPPNNPPPTKNPPPPPPKTPPPHRKNPTPTPPPPKKKDIILRAKGKKRHQDLCRETNIHFVRGGGKLQNRKRTRTNCPKIPYYR